MTATTTQLTGDALLALAEEMKDAPKSELVEAAGYFNCKGTANFTAFYEAFLAAKGIVPTQPEENDEEGDDCYEVSVPVYISVTVFRKPGLTKEEVLKSITWDEIADTDTDYISEAVETSINSGKNIIVYGNDGNELN